jgi:hypothetical protein
MNKKGNIAIIAVIIVIVAITAGVIGYFFAKKTQTSAVSQPAKTSNSQEQPAAESNQLTSGQQDNSQKPSQLISVDDKWNLYTNYKMGFSIKVPKLSYNDRKNLEVQVRENGEIIWLGVQNDFSKKLLPEFNDHKYKNKYDFVANNPFVIVIENIKNNQELLVFAKKALMLGGACKLGKSEYIPEKKLFNVKINETPASGDCWINMGYFIKYSPDKQKAAIWNGGQEEYFGLWDEKKGYLTDYDRNVEASRPIDGNTEVSDSFQFLD